ncbi:hypothetical protein HDU96_000849 [Phlyctochytrium bullatum]|nr:hypothetical protein HDU96_000849 [Phlyctochytrium bullatum]
MRSPPCPVISALEHKAVGDKRNGKEDPATKRKRDCELTTPQSASLAAKRPRIEAALNAFGNDHQHRSEEQSQTVVSSEVLANLPQFDHQVAGHKGNLYALEDSKKLLKPTTPTEAQFYRDAQGTMLEPFLPRFYGTENRFDKARPIKTLTEKEKLNMDHVSESVVIENVLHGLDFACIADIKIGKRLYGENATPEKIERMKHQAEITTSGALGLRICGMKLYNHDSGDYDEFGRDYGRSLSADTIIDGFRQFFSRSEASAQNEPSIDLGVLSECRSKAMELIKALQNEECRLYSSSLLIAYTYDILR